MSACSPDFNIMQANQPSIMQQQISRNFSARMLRKSNIYKIITENHHKGCSTEKTKRHSMGHSHTVWRTGSLPADKGRKVKKRKRKSCLQRHNKENQPYRKGEQDSQTLMMGEKRVWRSFLPPSKPNWRFFFSFPPLRKKFEAERRMIRSGWVSSA